MTSIVSILAMSNSGLTDLLIYDNQKIIKKNQYYRLLTSGFVHSDWMHLLFNMLSFYFFGRYLEYFFVELYGFTIGILLYVGLYLTAIALSDIYPLLFKRNSHFFSLGASGGVSAVVFAFILLSPLDKIYVFIFPIGIPGFIYGTLYLIYCSYAQGRYEKNVNHIAHLVGAVIGVLYLVAVFPMAVPNFFEQISGWSVF